MQRPLVDLVRVAFATIALALITGHAVARSDAALMAQEARIERLSGLAKAWGAVKFFHPTLAQRKIDWDGALIAAIPRVNAAATPTEYIAALNSMFAPLGDTGTRARLAADHSTGAKLVLAPQAVKPVRMDDGVLWIDALAAVKAAQAAAADAAKAAADTPTAEALRLAPTARAIVFDLRSSTELSDDDAYDRDDVLRTLLPNLLDRDITLASFRFRAHNGYPPQDGSMSGGYYSTMTTTTPEAISGQSKTKPPQIVVLIDQRSSALDTISGLQGHGLAFVVQDGAAPDTVYPATLPLTAEVELQLTTTELINPDGSIGFAADLISADGAATTATQALLAERKFVSQRVKPASANVPLLNVRDAPYTEMTHPTTAYRLLALFRYWNVIHYFYPNTNLIERGWDSVLGQYIAKFEANRDALEYQTTVLQLAAEMQDSHSFTRGADLVAAKIGLHLVPLQLREIQGQTVVTQVLDAKLPVHVGDSVLSIDGEPVAQRIAALTPIMPAATKQALSVSVHNSLLRGTQDSVAKLELRAPGGLKRTVELKRTLPRAELYDATLRKGATTRVLDRGVGYVDLARLQRDEVDAMFKTIGNTSATIFDMRGYPNGTASQITPRLTAKKSPINALFSRPYLEGYALNDDEISATTYSFEQRLPPAGGPLYFGKIVVLINAEAISHAEHSCLMFEVATDVTFIGTATMGANGDVTNVTLPGGLIAYFGGHNVRHADGRALQRVGIQPTIRVEPTILGLAAGRDEILEAAVDFLRPRTAPEPASR